MRIPQSRFQFDAPMIATILSGDRWRSVASALRLSPREKQILESMLLRMDTEIRIADRLGMSPRTVQTHVQRLRQKLGVTSREQLLVAALVISLRCDTVEEESFCGCPSFR
jgi:DNA-binding CsgD family transcriptional regulator